MRKRKIIARLFLYSLASVAILFFLSTLLLQIPPIRERAVHFVIEKIYAETGWRIQTESVSGFLPFHIQADRVTMVDSKSFEIAIQRLDIYYYPLDLLKEHFTSPYFSAKGVTLFNHAFDAEGQIEVSFPKYQISSHLFISFLDLPINPTNIHIEGTPDGENRSFSIELTQRPDIVIQGTCTLDNTFRITQSDFNLHAKDIKDIEWIKKIPLSGKISSHIEILGPIFYPTLSFEIKSPELSLFETPLKEFKLYTLASISNDQILAPVSIEGILEETPVHFSSLVSFGFNEPLRISDITGSMNSLTVSGGLEIDPFEFLINGKLQGKIENITDFSYLGVQPFGRSEFFFTFFSQNGNQQGVEGTIEFFHTSIGPVNLQYCKGMAQIEDLFRSPLGKLSFVAKGIRSDSIFLKEASFATNIFSTDLSLWPYSFSASGNWHSDMQLTASGGWRVDKENFDLSLEIFTGKGGLYPIDLKNGVTLHVDKQQMSLSPLEIQIGSGKCIATVDTSDSEVQGFFEADQIPIELFNTFICPQIPLKGKISAAASMHGRPSLLKGRASLQMNQVSIEEEIFANFPLIDGQFEAELDGSVLKTSGYLSAGKMFPARWQGEIPCKFSLLPFHISTDSKIPITGKLIAEGEISHLLKLFVTDTTSVTGYAKTSVDFGGTWKKPKLRGTAVWMDGTFESLDSGAIIQNIHAVIEGDEKQFVLKELTANTGRTGSLQATGFVKLEPKAHYPFEVSALLNKAAFIRLDTVQATASGSLNCEGNLDLVSISGNMILDQANIRIPQKLPVPLQTVEITYLRKKEKEMANPSIMKPKEMIPILLDLHLLIPGKAFVQGGDLTSEWKGEITFTGTTEQPLLNGSAQMISGGYLFNGRSFTGTKGNIHFAGDPAKKTSIYLVAEREIENIKVEAILKGSINDSKLTLRSNPPLPEKEILSWILFNRGTSEISSFQQTELNTIDFTLSSGKDDGDVLSKLRTSVGIDRLDISKSENGDTDEVSVRVGKYLSKGVFVSVNKGINAEKKQIAIEANLFRNIKAQAEVGDNSEAKMSLKWMKDY